MERGNQQRGSSFGQESQGSRQQESRDQDVSNSRNQNPQSGDAWENYRTRELSGNPQRQEGIEGRSENLNGSNEGNLEQDDMD